MTLLTKTLYLAGRRCPKLLWFRAHEPEAEELRPDAGEQWLLEQGQEVTRQARAFSPALRAEVSFERDGLLARTDLVDRADAGIVLIEVKGASSRTDEHADDVAFQVFVAERAGERVARAELLTLDREAEFPFGSGVFAREDLTAAVRALQPRVALDVAEMRATLDGPRPDTPVGVHCLRGGDCPFVDRCWPRPRDHVTRLFGINKAEAVALADGGVRSVTALDDTVLARLKAPPGVKGPAALIARRHQRDAERTGALVVGPGLAAALASLRTPVVHLDFETVNFALPRFAGTHPWTQIPVQVSAHVEEGSGTVHHEFVTDGPGDPRPAVIDAVVAACRGGGTVLAWYAAFEDGRLRELAEAFPARAAELEEVRHRLVDLLPVVREHVYHPDFAGSFSLKAVLPALVPGLGYDDLAIRNGGDAMAILARLMTEGDAMTAEDRTRFRRDLLAYCERDTLAMVRLLARLRALARG